MISAFKDQCSRCLCEVNEGETRSCLSSHFEKEDFSFEVAGICDSYGEGEFYCSRCMDKGRDFCKCCESKLSKDQKEAVIQKYEDRYRSVTLK